ncbi:hypothetical protein GCM10027444_06470 [Actinopolyspora lacussalsi]
MIALRDGSESWPRLREPHRAIAGTFRDRERHVIFMLLGELCAQPGGQVLTVIPRTANIAL